MRGPNKQRVLSRPGLEVWVGLRIRAYALSLRVFAMEYAR